MALSGAISRQCVIRESSRHCQELDDRESTKFAESNTRFCDCKRNATIDRLATVWCHKVELLLETDCSFDWTRILKFSLHLFSAGS